MHIISIAARNSPLSQVQVKEVLEELRGYYPSIDFHPTYLASTGDKDLHTSLRTLGKTDFFTREVDELVLNRQVRVGIHSAKDLPDPLPKGLVLAALTKGIDPADALVMREGEAFDQLPSGAVIATSSERREAAVRQMRADLSFIDLRGTIGQRLAKLDTGEADGVVVAEAALIRLGLTHLNRMIIPGETVPFQGQLAIAARADDSSVINLFRCLDSRGFPGRTLLYLGLNPPQSNEVRCLHYPIIKIKPRPLHEESITKMFCQLSRFTHGIFTSQSAVSIFFEYLISSNNKMAAIKNMHLLAVGRATEKKIREFGLHVHTCADEESAEGLIHKLESMDLKNAKVLWPHSALSRSVLEDYFMQKKIAFESCILYDTVPNRDYPLPNLDKVDEILFTSPSCVDAYIEILGHLPSNKPLACIGPVTQSYLSLKLNAKQVIQQ